MARLNLYLSDDLRARMDAAEGVNWSQIAQRAFERELAQIAGRKAETSMDDVIRRLRASKLEAEGDGRKAGRQAGARWAQQQAGWTSLVRLAAFCEAREATTNEPWEVRGLYDTILYETIEGGSLRGDLDLDECGRFWQEQGLPDFGGDEEMAAGWFEGFARGAFDVYLEVRDKV